MNPFDYYTGVFKNYADFSGRARRSEYWYFTLFNGLIAIGLMIVDMFVIGNLVLYSIYILASLIPTFAVAVRRLHDTNKSGWFMLISIIPIIGSIILLVFLCTDSEQGENQYGLNPKDPSIAYNDGISEHLVE